MYKTYIYNLYIYIYIYIGFTSVNTLTMLIVSLMTTSLTIVNGKK